MKLQTRRIPALCAALLCLSVFMQTGALGAKNASEHSWYFKLGQNNKPIFDENFRFIEELGGFYFDTEAYEKGDKVIYLTFDAGYENGNVEKILDVLKDHGAKGTFFVLENLIKRNPELVCRMANEGHTVANHTATHKDMSKISDVGAFKQELDRLAEVYTEITGKEMAKIYRPPQGKFSKENLEFANSLGYKTVFWSFAYADWDNEKQPQAKKAIDKILTSTHNGEIILLHPTSKTNADIMDELLCEWERMGYRFGSLEELTGCEAVS